MGFLTVLGNIAAYGFLYLVGFNLCKSMYNWRSYNYSQAANVIASIIIAVVYIWALWWIAS